MMKDPATPLGKRVGIYLFFLGHMAAFGTATFYMSYHVQQGGIYAIGAIPVILYVFFYLLLFGVDEMLWFAITSALGLLMVHGWLAPLAQPFIPAPGTAGEWIVTDFAKFPASRHILPATFLLMYEFTLRNLLIDVLGARHDARRNALVGGLFVAISGAQILLAEYR